MAKQDKSLPDLLKPIKFELFCGLGFSFFINILMLVSPIFMLQAYDRVLPSRSELTLLMLLVLAVFLLGIMGALDSLRHQLMSKTATKLDSGLAPAVFQSVVALNRLKPNPASNNYFHDIQSIKHFIGGTPICVFFDAPWVPLFILCNYFIHPLLGSITLFGAASIFGIAYANERLSRTPTEKAQQAQSRAQHYISKGLEQIDTIRALGMTEKFQRQWLELHKQANAYHDQSNIQAGAFSASSKAYRLILQTVILGAGCWLAIEQAVTPGAMIAASIIMGRALAPVEQAIGTWRVFIKARAAFINLDKLLTAFPGADEKIHHERPIGELCVDKLIVIPPGGEEAILKGLSFAIPAGGLLLIVGASGTGKSTLGKALAGLWQPRNGSVQLDGIDLRQWNSDELGSHIGYLGQQIAFLPGTIAQNIARFQDCTDDEIIEAAKLSGAHSQITRFKHGYDTILDTEASTLSSGQRQTIGLARAVFRKPSLLILDEPNAHFDRNGDANFLNMLDRLKALQITTVVISHKNNVLNHADYYLEIKHGQTALFGPVSEIMKTSRNVEHPK